MKGKSTVYVTKEDKDKLLKHIKEINHILEKYPYTNDYSDHFITTMTRVKNSCLEAEKSIGRLNVIM